jgi:hypothetical protein
MMNRGTAAERAWERLELDGVSALPVLALGGGNDETHFLADGAGQETAHGMGLPARSFQKFLHADPLRPFQQIEDLGRLASIADRTGLLRAFGRLRGCFRLAGRLRLLGRNVRALSDNTGPWRAPGSSMGAATASMINLVICDSPWVITAITTSITLARRTRKRILKRNKWRRKGNYAQQRQEEASNGKYQLKSDP